MIASWRFWQIRALVMEVRFRPERRRADGTASRSRPSETPSKSTGHGVYAGFIAMLASALVPGRG